MGVQVIDHMTGNTHTGPKTHNGSPQKDDAPDTSFASVTEAVDFAKAKKMEHFSVTADGNLAYKELGGNVEHDASKAKPETVTKD